MREGITSGAQEVVGVPITKEGVSVGEKERGGEVQDVGQALKP